MPTRKNTTTSRARGNATSQPAATTSAGAKSDEFNLPAEPEVTRRSATAGAATSNPGREPAGGPVGRAARERAYRENAMRNRETAQNQTASCGPRTTTGLMGLIGGAGLGAVLMYLLDPEAGEQRRTHLSERATRAASTTGNVAGNLWDMATEAGGALVDRATEAGTAGAAAASSLGSRFTERAGDTAHSLHKGARRQMTSARNTASGWFGHEEESRYVPSATTAMSAATALAAGVGLMYLLDPTDGARRRNVLLGKTTRFLNETGDFFRRTGRHLSNRSRGVVHETRSMFQSGEVVSDRQLAERIRSRIGHLQQQSNVNVVATDGRITITGQCSPDDVEALLSTVQSTPGVASIVNLLDVQSANA
jgi:hypothetical protein